MNEVGTFASWLLVGVGLVTSESRADTSAFEIVREASRAATRALSSGEGEGCYRAYRKQPEAPDWKVWTEAKIRIYFDHDKYHVRLEYRHDFLRSKERRIVFDGTVIATSRFSSRLSGVGAQGELFEPQKLGSTVLAGVADFRWDVAHLPACVLDVDALLRNLAPEQPELVFHDSKEIRFQYTLVGNGEKVLCTCLRKYGFNISRVAIYLPRNSTTVDAQEVEAQDLEWKNSGGVWYITSVKEIFRAKTKWFRTELILDHFEPNVPVDSKLFTLSALGLPGGARILDHRPSVNERIHFVRANDKAIEKALGSLVDQVEKLPTPNVRHTEKLAMSQVFFRRCLIMAHAVALVVVVYLFLARSKRLSRKEEMEK